MIQRTVLSPRYSETDMMGVIYHGSYLPWFEVARTELLESLGFPYIDMEEQGLISPVLDVELHYGRSMVYGEDAVIYTRIVKTTPVRTVYGYEVYAASDDPAVDKPRCYGSTTHCLLSRDDMKPLSLKKAVPGLLEAYRASIAEDAEAAQTD